MRPVGVVARDDVIEPGLLLEDVGGRGLGRFALQGEVHALVPAITRLRWRRPGRPGEIVEGRSR